MIQLLVAAPSSGSGKTTVACALLALLRARGCAPCAFKCGPDYIDPMFHRAVIGVPSHNLDLFFSSADAVRGFYARGAAGYGAAVCEGAMGLYDGLGGTSDKASAWHIADTLGLPVLLVVPARGASLTLAAQLRGLCTFRARSRIAGVILNNCTPRAYAMLAPMLEAECGIPVLGYLPPLPAAAIASRHLGLYTAAEITDLQQRLAVLAAELAKTLDWPRFERVFDMPAPLPPAAMPPAPYCADIAVARDEAFCFAYAETLEALEQCGLRLRYFSPIRDKALPQGASGLYLPGGYPELYAKQLAANAAMRTAVREAVRAGMPTAAECCGFLYLGSELQGQDGTFYPMAGALCGRGCKTGGLVRFGYAELMAQTDSLLMRAGESLPVHEFHHWDSTANGTAFTAQKPFSGQSWQCGFASGSLYAGFAHLYWASTPLPQRFAAAAQKYKEASTK